MEKLLLFVSADKFGNKTVLRHSINFGISPLKLTKLQTLRHSSNQGTSPQKWTDPQEEGQTGCKSCRPLGRQ